jgi:hypothetical protein
MKGYYKYRPRKGDTTLQTDLRGEGNILVDGYLTFPKEDGSLFTATVEASSQMTKGEIVFKKMQRLLFWDALTVSLVLTTVLFGWSHVKHWITVDQVGPWAATGALVLSALFWFFFYRLFFSGLQRYRYIYALEQFKRYYADEQWVAFGEDVFAKPQSKYLEELKRQCIKNGFGLLKVMEDQECVPIITPARYQVQSGRREIMDFVSQRKWSARFLEGGGNLFSRLRSRIPVPEINLSRERFQRRYYNQWAIIALALFLIGGIFYVEFQKAAEIYVNETEYNELVQTIQADGTEEPSYFLVDTPFLSDPFPIAELPPPVFPELEEEKAEKITPPDPVDPDELLNTPQAGVMQFGDTLVNVFDCSRFMNLDGMKYLIVEGNYRSLEVAKDRMRTLADADPPPSLLWMGCFDTSRRDYVVFFGVLYNSAPESATIARNLERQLRQAGFGSNTLQVVTVETPR